MQVKLWLSIETQDRTGGAQAQKVVKSGHTVAPGMFVQDFAWKEPRLATNICLSTDTADVLSVCMGREETVSGAHFRQVIDMYRSHGWTVEVYGE